MATATVTLNMVLAPFLIFGWWTGVPLGVAGAAISSLVAVVVGVVWLAMYLVKPGAYLRFVPSQWVPQTSLWAQMLKIGLPAGAEFALIAVYLFVVYTISRPFGAAAQAGFGIGLRIVQAGFMPVVALGFSVAPVAGQNFGARLPERVRKTYITAAAMAAGVMALWAVACHFGAGPMVRFFSADPQVIDVGEEYLASSRGRSSDPAWCSSHRACSRRLATRCRRWPPRSGGCSSPRFPRSTLRASPDSSCAGSGISRPGQSCFRWRRCCGYSSGSFVCVWGQCWARRRRRSVSFQL